MLAIFMRIFRRNRRANISRELDHLYADMRRAQENTRLAKLYAEQIEAKMLENLRAKEKKLIKEAKQLDAQDLHRSIPTRSARA